MAKKRPYQEAEDEPVCCPVHSGVRLRPNMIFVREPSSQQHEAMDTPFYEYRCPVPECGVVYNYPHRLFVRR